MADVKYIGKNILNHDLILNRGNVSGSATSTGSFGHVIGTLAGISIDGAEDTAISAPSNGHILSYSTASSKWENSGASSDLVGFGQKFKHTQGSANVTWTITHSMGFQYPNVNVYDSNDKLVIPTEVTATSADVLTVTFDSPVAGTAILSTGGSATSGGQNYNHTQGSANTTWTVSHNLEYQYPAVTVYDSNSDVIIPQRIRATNANTLTLTFTQAESGYAHVSVGGGLPYVTATNSGKYLRVKDDASGVEWALSQFSGSSQFTGSVGITGSLDVTGDATIGGNLTFGDAATDSVAFGAEINSHIIPDADDTYNIGSASKTWKTGSFQSVHSTDKIGIGTSSPSEALHIKGDASRFILSSADHDLFFVGNAGSGVNLDDGTLQLKTNGVTTGQIYPTGDSFLNGASPKLGIGTASPSKALHVVGEALVSDKFTVSNKIYCNIFENISSGTIYHKVYGGAKAIVYLSKSLTEQQQNYATHERETLAVLYSLESVSYTHLTLPTNREV